MSHLGDFEHHFQVSVGDYIYYIPNIWIYLGDVQLGHLRPTHNVRVTRAPWRNLYPPKKSPRRPRAESPEHRTWPMQEMLQSNRYEVAVAVLLCALAAPTKIIVKLNEHQGTI